MKILVTGASGFIGSAVCKALAAAGHDVLRASLRRWRSIGPELGNITSDGIVHCHWAGVDSWQRDDAVLQGENVRTFLNVLDYCRVNPTKVFISPGSQAEIYQPSCAYATAKERCLEILKHCAAEISMRWAWLRLFSVYGPGQGGDWLIPSIAGKLARGETVDMTPGDQAMDFLHVDDVAAAVLAAIESSACGVYEVGCGHSIPLKVIASNMASFTGGNPRQLNFGALPYPEGQVMNACAQPQQFKLATGWNPKVDFNEGLRSVVELIKSNATHA